MKFPQRVAIDTITAGLACANPAVSIESPAFRPDS
jgi:hypothetical protein